MADPSRVLVIDDDPNLTRLLSLLLEMEGWEACVERDGISGLRHALESPVDLILLDLMLPGLSGWEVLKRLRESEQTREVPVIVLSARGGEVTVDGADYMSKPFDPQVLVERVRGKLAEAT
ncbi:MAG TPA: response regulator [Candidatus Dormibacteraeota bacterium]|nr:response regulator [Candidatus Dormibacteraeota bacterium]